MIAGRDPLGATRVFVELSAQGDARKWAHGVRPLLRANPSLDREGIRSAWGLSPEPRPGAALSRTCFAAVRSLPPGHSLTSLRPLAIEEAVLLPAPCTLRDALLAWAERLPEGCAIALSGGLDSALLLALLRAVGRRPPPVVTLRTPWSDYDEREAVDATARVFGARLECVVLSESDVLDAVDEAVSSIETCLYNLHPVGRYLLACGAVRQGYRELVTGDGADQLLAHAPSERFIPLVAALVAGAGATLRSPFLDAAVQAAAPRTADPEKQALRALARELSLRGETWAERPKRPRMMPALDLSARLDAARLDALARATGLPLALESDAERVRWLTLASLSRTFGATRCVG